MELLEEKFSPKKLLLAQLPATRHFVERRQCHVAGLNMCHFCPNMGVDDLTDGRAVSRGRAHFWTIASGHRVVGILCTFGPGLEPGGSQRTGCAAGSNDLLHFTKNSQFPAQRQLLAP